MNYRLAIIFVFGIANLNMINFADVYISKVINNTKQRVTFEYAVPTNTKARIAKLPAYDGPNLHTALLHDGIYVNPHLKSTWNVHINSGKTVVLVDAYIPMVSHSDDFQNVITMKTGSDSSSSNDLTFSSIRVHKGYLEIVSPEKKVVLPFSESLVYGTSYTLKINQKTEALYFLKGSGKPHFNTDAYELVLMKD